jgi:hypothetical protein
MVASLQVINIALVVNAAFNTVKRVVNGALFFLWDKSQPDNQGCQHSSHG